MDELLSHLKSVKRAFHTEGVCADDFAAFMNTRTEYKVDVAHAAAGQRSLFAQGHGVENLISSVVADSIRQPPSFRQDRPITLYEESNQVDGFCSDNFRVPKLCEECLWNFNV